MRVADLALPWLRRLEPETAHRVALAGLRYGVAGARRSVSDPRLATAAFGRTLKNPIGLAAGFDKDATALGGLSRLGFGFVEAGTVTPRAQWGNPRPRLFRLAEDEALINRMGFNNRGIEAFSRNLARAANLVYHDEARVAIGANIGINKDGAMPLSDYPALVRAVSHHADYITVNVSSPNTPGLRDLQATDRLGAILGAIEREAGKHPPLFVKLAPDLAEAALPDLVALAIGRGIAGLIIGNTTVARPTELRGAARGEAGGLSGAPLFSRSTRMLAKVRLLAGDKLTLIGVGGIATPDQAFAKFRAGANLVQLYTSFVYQGPAVIGRIATGLTALLDRYECATLSEVVGRDADRLAEL